MYVRPKLTFVSFFLCFFFLNLSLTKMLMLKTDYLQLLAIELELIVNLVWKVPYKAALSCRRQLSDSVSDSRVVKISSASCTLSALISHPTGPVVQGQRMQGAGFTPQILD